jgi:hypothetical protein
VCSFLIEVEKRRRRWNKDIVVIASEAIPHFRGFNNGTLNQVRSGASANSGNGLFPMIVPPQHCVMGVKERGGGGRIFALLVEGITWRVFLQLLFQN